MEIYQEGFKKLDLGLASALSYVLLLATLILSLDPVPLLRPP